MINKIIENSLILSIQQKDDDTFNYLFDKFNATTSYGFPKLDMIDRLVIEACKNNKIKIKDNYRINMFIKIKI